MSLSGHHPLRTQPSNIPPLHYSMVAAKALISILLKNKRYFIKQG